MFIVAKTEDLNNIIIPHFTKYLLTQKQADFELFKLVVDMVKRKEHLTEEGLIKIISIRAWRAPRSPASLHQRWATLQ
jgi:hypothetical protein